MTDRDLPPLDDEVRALVDRAMRAEAAPTEARARVLARVEGLLGPPSGGPAGGGSGTAAGAASSARWWGRALPLAASFALGAGAGAIAMRSASHVVVSTEAPRIVYVDRPAPAAPEPAHEIPTDTAPSTAPGGQAAAPQLARSGHASAASGDGPAQLAAERALLDVARAAIERQDGAAALAATEQHERRYPRGILVQEREAMAVRALVLMGRTEDARARAARFGARFPGSLLLPTVESAVRSLP